MLVLTLGMGLGRFLYTPMLPVMLAEGEFSFSELSWIASGNYAGYLAGSLLFSGQLQDAAADGIGHGKQVVLSNEAELCLVLIRKAYGQL